MNRPLPHELREGDIRALTRTAPKRSGRYDPLTTLVWMLASATAVVSTVGAVRAATLIWTMTPK